MSEVHNMREIENLEVLIRDKDKEIERLRAALEVTTNDCKEAFANNEKLWAALKEITEDNWFFVEDARGIDVEEGEGL